MGPGPQSYTRCSKYFDSNVLEITDAQQTDTAFLNEYYILKQYAGSPDLYDILLYYKFRYDASQMSPDDPSFHDPPARVAVANALHCPV